MTKSNYVTVSPYSNLVVSSTNSGDIIRTTDGTFTAMRGADGNLVHSNPTRANVELVSSNTTDIYNNFYRGVISFDTSNLPSGCIIDSAILDMPGYGKSNSFSTKPGFGITSFSPATSGAFVKGDFDTFGSTRFASDISYDNLSISDIYGINVWNFNNDGKNAINRDGWTNLMIRTSWDIDNSPPTWVPLKTTYFNFYTSGTPAKTPKLNITYHM